MRAYAVFKLIDTFSFYMERETSEDFKIPYTGFYWLFHYFTFIQQ